MSDSADVRVFTRSPPLPRRTNAVASTACSANLDELQKMLALQEVGSGKRRLVLLPSLSSGTGFQTIGRVDLELDAVRTISRQHCELSRNGASITVRALHRNAIKVLRGEEEEGLLLSKLAASGPSRAEIRPGDLLEIGDVRPLLPCPRPRPRPPCATSPTVASPRSHGRRCAMWATARPGPSASSAAPTRASRHLPARAPPQPTGRPTRHPPPCRARRAAGARQVAGPAPLREHPSRPRE